ncbi:MAG TPA: hypothetical protein VM243_00220 [Phycisphaerae bacterium]|nr:hypothetical protein [Phycisphaerae bacterium]
MGGQNVWMFVRRALEQLLTTPALCMLTGVVLLVGSLWLASGFFKSSACHRMNLKQRWVVCLAGFVGFAMLLYPPWIVTDQVWERSALEGHFFLMGTGQAGVANRSSEHAFARETSAYAPFYIWYLRQPPRRTGGLYTRPSPVRWHPLKQPTEDGYVVVAWTCRPNIPRLLLQFALTAVVGTGLFLALRGGAALPEVRPAWEQEGIGGAARPAIHKR